MTGNIEKDTLYIKHSFDRDFVILIRNLYADLGPDIFAIQGIAEEHLDIVKYRESFFNSAVTTADITVDPNANNPDKSVFQFNKSSSKPLARLDSISLLYSYIKKMFGKKEADECISALVDGRVFMNDLHNVNTGYCYSFDLTKLVTDGLDFFGGQFEIKKPKRIETFINLVIQATAYISNQITGAIAYPNFFLYMDYFLRKDKDFGPNYQEKIKTDPILADRLKEYIENVIFSFNYPFREAEPSFTNLSILDRGFIDSLFKGTVFPDGSQLTEDIKDSIIELSKTFFDRFTYINANLGIFTFPVTTLAHSLDESGEFLDKDMIEWASTHNNVKGLANVLIDSPSSFSSCCRLRNDFSKLYQNSFGVGGVSIGSLRCAGINFNRIDSEADLITNAEIVHKLLLAQRAIVVDRIKTGNLPLYSKGWIFIEKQFSTVGFIGAYEHLLREGIDIKEAPEEGAQAITKALGIIEKETEKWVKRDAELGYRTMYNIEQIPGESMAIRLAKIDAILDKQNNFEMYANQYVPLTENVDMYTRLLIQGIVDQKTSGGAIAHINIKDNYPLTPELYRAKMEIARKLKVKYFAINYAFSKCANNHYFVTNAETCPVCNAEIVETFTRVVGYLTSTKHWHKTRREYEFPRRVFYKSE